MNSKYIVRLLSLCIIQLVYLPTFGQDNNHNDLEKLLEDNNTKAPKEYVFGAFKSVKVVNGQSIENTAKGNLDFRIAHRFTTMSGGIHEFFGLDGATVKLSLDYGLTDNIMVGIGRSTLYKEYDAFVKAKILRQTTKDEMPISLSYVGGMSVSSLAADKLLGRPLVSPEKFYFSNRLFYFNQLLIARKFGSLLTVQLSPSHVHYNLVSKASEPNDLFSTGIGARIKINRRLTLNAEYFYQFDRLNNTHNSFSLGCDIETGGHVFQLHFTNSAGMTERTFITQTTDQWKNGGFRFGFNISRIFTIVQPKEFENSRNKIW